MLYYSDNWDDYKKYINELNTLPKQSKQYKDVANKLFETYELYYNKNNTIEPITVKTILRQWLSSSCFAMLVEEKQNFIESIDFNAFKTAKDIIDYIIKNLSEQFCLLSCSETTNNDCFHTLSYEIMKHCNRFIFFPRNNNNIEIFLHSSPMYLESEISQKDYFNSPIEEIMYESLLPLIKKYGYTLKREYTVRDAGRTEIRYALDLAVLKGEKLVLDIETDGLSFHKDYNSMASDRQRDRWLLMRGVPTIRFTSREVFDDLENSLIQIEEVLTVIKKWNG